MRVCVFVFVELVLSDVSSSRVSQCVENKMDKHNLARVFGPTLVGHAVPDPDPMTILHDTNRQPRVTKSRHSEFYMDAVGFFSPVRFCCSTLACVFISPQVVERLLCIPTKYWSQFACADNASLGGAPPPATPDQRGKALQEMGGQ